MNRSKYRELLLATTIPDSATEEESKKLRQPLVNAALQLLPKKLYRFRSCSKNDFDALLNDKIYFNTPSRFNDPYDCMPLIDMELIERKINEYNNLTDIEAIKQIRSSEYLNEGAFSPNIISFARSCFIAVKGMADDEYEKLLSKAQNFDVSEIKTKLLQLADEVEKSYHNLFQNKTHISCFSERVDSLLMWGHYADSHKGFALEYEAVNLFNTKQINPCLNCDERCQYEYTVSLEPVLYSNQRFDATSYISEWLNYQVYLQNMDDNFSRPDKLFMDKVYTHKEITWKYEKEWRLIYLCKQNKPEGNCIIVKPTAIYLGSKISNADVRVLKKIIQDKGIKMYQMEVDTKKYRLNKKLVNGEVKI